MPTATPSASWATRSPTCDCRAMAGAFRARCFSARSKDPRPTQKGLSRKHVVDACHDALKRLRVDYLDLYYCHRPDPQAPIVETVWAMDGLIRQGKVLYWGTSEWPAEQIREAHDVARAHNLHAPTMEQPQYNLLHRGRVEVEYASLYRDFGMGTTIWSPLASGLLTGKYNAGIPARFAAGPGRLRLVATRRVRRSAVRTPGARAQVHGPRRAAAGRAGVAGDRLVPAQPERLVGAARRHEHHATATEPRRDRGCGASR